MFRGDYPMLETNQLSRDDPFLALLHPSHIAFLRDTPMNTLEYFLGCLDELPEDKRDAMFAMTYAFLIQPQYPEAVTGKETLGELQIDQVDYMAFKQRCYQIVQTGLMSDILLTYLL